MNLRIASLVPSVTELVAALGLAPYLVARTGFCIHPADSLAAVPKVGGTKDVNLPKLQRLAPSHVIVNVDENRRDTIEAIRAWPVPPRIVVTHPKAPDDNLGLVAQLAAEFGAEPGVGARAEALCQALGRELDATRPEGRPPLRVLYLIWQNPWMTVARDTYIATMLSRVNWQTLPAQSGGEVGAARYPVVMGDEAWLADVDMVLLSSEPYAFDERHVAAARALCPNARAQIVDGEMLSWFGSRAVAGLAYLRRIAGDG
jgi:ABC-type Fe3+-hydroxamate transport system substrate-binding protein